MAHLYLSKTNIEVVVPLNDRISKTIKIQDYKLVIASDEVEAKGKVEVFYKEKEITHFTIIIETPIE